MKRIAFASVLFLIIASTGFSQLFFSAHRDRIIMDFNADIWSNQPEGLEMKSLSRTFNITMFRDIRLNRNFAIGIGLGISGTNLYTNQIFEDSANSSPWSLPQEGSGYNFKEVANGYDLKQSKLFFGYFNLPVELRYRNLNTPHLFRISVGARGGLISSASTKVNLENQNGIFGNGSQAEYKYKEFGVKNINKFQFGLTARIGYGRFGINASLPLTAVFKDNDSTDMNFFSIGVSMFML
jgi:hypothetical protein